MLSELIPTEPPQLPRPSPTLTQFLRLPRRYSNVLRITLDNSFMIKMQQGPPAWLPNVYNCSYVSGEKKVIQPICNQAGGNKVGEWCSRISTKSAPHVKRLLPFYTNSACQKKFGAGFTAECITAGYALCFGLGEECY
ncbi:hypothetical protein DM02DRAFT_653386 [Periconia macrospinosa]|uniref:Uncharacterized protein n=1 Tax=Periconia macrospinosa TaxID=97972 RepID=A0A2V1DWT8_9PLEO|nr:hypothetical protein DM02DRAFT_653386 [Periconia macrospinosa]